MKRWTAQFIEALLQAPDYRSFLRVFLAREGLDGRAWSYAQFTHRAGFSSRAYVREVILGLRRLTAKSLGGFVQAMGLSAEWKEYFRLLVSLEESDANFNGWSDDKRSNQLAKLRERLRRKNRPRLASEACPAFSEKLFELKCIPRVYAALGTQEGGANLEEIQARTSLPSAKLRSALQRLMELDLIEELPEKGRMRAKNMHLIRTELGKCENFQSVFLDALDQAKLRATQSIDAPDALFFVSSLSISRSSLPKLKAELREFLINFVDQAENSSGDVVVNLATALHR